MQIDFMKFIYLFFRMSPFIVVTFFTLQSIFNKDLKGLIYLCGLLITCIIVTSIGSSINIEDLKKEGISTECTITYLGMNSEALSKVFPLSVVVLGFTFWYITFIIIDNQLASKNVSFFILFILLILGDAYWQNSNGCSDIRMIGGSHAISLICGVIWFFLIKSTGYIDLQLFNGISSAEVCSRPQRNKYKCTIVRKAE